MKCVLGLAAELHRVGQRANHLLEFHDRPGPAVGHYQRLGVGFRRTDMQKVKGQAINFGHKPGILV